MQRMRKLLKRKRRKWIVSEDYNGPDRRGNGNNWSSPVTDTRDDMFCVIGKSVQSIFGG